MKTFSEILKEERQLKGYNQFEFAEAVGIAQPTLCTYETGKSQPNLLFLLCIADVLGVSMDYLAGRTDKKEVNR